MAVVDRLETIFSLRDNYTDGANKATAATKRLSDAQRVAATTSKQMQASLSNIKKPPIVDHLQAARNGWRNFGDSATASFDAIAAGASKIAGTVAAIVAIPAAVIGAEIALFNLAKGVATKAADFEALEKSLIAVEGSSKAAGAEMKRLLAIAQGPGLGQQETIAGYAQLRNAGLTQSLSERLIRELGNANARAGGGPQQLAGILRQISQAASKPYLQGEELSTLTENGIPAYKIVKDALGTADTEELKRKGVTSVQVLEAIAASLERTERVAGGTKNSFDNLMDTINMASISAGKGVNESFGPLADELNELVAAADKGNVFKDLGRDIADALSFGDLDMEEAFINVIAFAKTGVQWFGRLKDHVLGALGPIGKLIGWVWSKSPVGDAWMTDFNANRDMVRADIQGGRQRNEAEKRRAERERSTELAIAAASQPGAAPTASTGGGIGDILNAAAAGLQGMIDRKEADKKAHLEAYRENTRATNRNSDIQDRTIDLQKIIQGGGGFADAPTSELSIARVTNRHKGGGGRMAEFEDMILSGVRGMAGEVAAMTERSVMGQARQAGAV